MSDETHNAIPDDLDEDLDEDFDEDFDEDPFLTILAELQQQQGNPETRLCACPPSANPCAHLWAEALAVLKRRRGAVPGDSYRDLLPVVPITAEPFSDAWYEALYERTRRHERLFHPAIDLLPSRFVDLLADRLSYLQQSRNNPC